MPPPYHLLRAFAALAAAAAIASACGGSVGGGGRACVPEDCTNGADDDCNGLVDCADPACAAGFTCTPLVDAAGGFALVAFEPASRAPCPSGFAATDLAVAPDAPSTCRCDCGGGEVSCTLANVFLEYASAPRTQCPAQTGHTLLATGCTDLSAAPIPSGALVRSGVPVIAQTACAEPTPIAVIAAPTAGRICAPATSDGGCPGGTCAARSPGRLTCVAHDGDVACPAGYPRAFHAGTSAEDGRACSACTCATLAASCANAKVTLYAGARCTGDPLATFAASGVCLDVGNAAEADSATFAAVPSGGGCGAKIPSSLGGKLVLHGERTICCAL